MLQNWLQTFVLTFIPLFIAIDALGTLPIIITVSEKMTRKMQVRTINISIVTAMIVSLVFLFFGHFILNVLGISVGSFAVAGGIILLIISVRYMLTGHVVEVNVSEMVAIVPIGTPLLAGPATIATLLLMSTQYNLMIVVLALLINMVLVWLIFLVGNSIAAFTGVGGLKAITQIFSLLLSAIAVSMIIRGLNMLGVISSG